MATNSTQLNSTQLVELSWSLWTHKTRLNSTQPSLNCSERRKLTKLSLPV